MQDEKLREVATTFQKNKTAKNLEAVQHEAASSVPAPRKLAKSSPCWKNSYQPRQHPAHRPLRRIRRLVEIEGFRVEPAGEQLDIFGGRQPVMRVFRAGRNGKEQKVSSTRAFDPT